ncbi:FAD-binding oxidoreductase [Saprospira grandis]|uniref:FAD-binding oxidoreductase n=1 Tax=Saprospira grandis TaxID=1008 RepID=UPI0022DE4624|nr:FAD-binding oxidoreductase [Saprospira grandis]WBM75953.1 FAD-dependent oxidoreductase [Saprospira grandis]
MYSTSTLEEYLKSILPATTISMAPKAAKENLTEYQAPDIIAELRPTSQEELAAILALAQEEGLKLYPISSGFNWGLGSKLPVEGPAILINLNQWKSIEVSEELEYAIIGAGVTQKDLHDYLERHQLALKFPLTGSSQSTSILGNILDRGASAFFHRRQRLLGLEILLPSGKWLQTGLWHFHKTSSSPPPLYYAAGLGPDLNGLFTQSNLGITTRAIIQLQPQSSGILFFADFQEELLIPMIQKLRKLRQDNMLNEGILLTNKNDPRTTEGNPFDYNGQWTLIGSFSGSASLLQFLQTELSLQLAQYCQKIEFVSSNSTTSCSHPYQEVLRDLYNGCPSDYSIQTMAKLQQTSVQSAHEVDSNKNFPGMAVALLAVPFHGPSCLELMELIYKISLDMKVRPFYNLASLDETTFEGFFRVYFDRNDPEASKNAKKWSQRVLQEAAEKLAIFPYRLSTEQMALFCQDKEDAFWQTVKQIKNSLDPQNLIAPKRYNLV